MDAGVDALKGILGALVWAFRIGVDGSYVSKFNKMCESLRRGVMG
jgi:hypothetical protein